MPVPKVRRRPGIATRLIVGFGALTMLVFAIAVANLAVLKRVSLTNESILEADVPVLDATERWIEEVLEQEYYARRAAILGSELMRSVAREEAQEFRKGLDALDGLPAADWVPRARLRQLHATYTELLELPAGPDPAAEQVRTEQVRTIQAELIGLLKSTALEARRNQLRKAEENVALGTLAFRLMAGVCAIAVLVSAVATLLLTRGIARPIRTLRTAAGRIAAGRFDVVPDVPPGDELGDLAADFAEMARRLKRLEEMYLDASPLTRLPGNIAIENVLGKRIARGAPFVFCLVDLDNFKAYNDRYGYARGSELIKSTAHVVEQAVRERGDPSDFVGHIGGDDFVIITTPDRYREICNAVIVGFDGLVAGHYDPEDVRRGYVVGKNRQGQPARHPVTSVSIAVVTNTDRSFESPIQVGEVAADLKEYAKSLTGSVYVVDRRRREDAHGLGSVVPFPKSG